MSIKNKLFSFPASIQFSFFNACLCSGFSEEPCIIFASSPYKEITFSVKMVLTAHRFIAFPEFQKDTNWILLCCLAEQFSIFVCFFPTTVLRRKGFPYNALEGFTGIMITKNILKHYFVCYLKWKMLSLKTLAFCHLLQNISWFTVRTAASRRNTGAILRNFSGNAQMLNI